MVWRQFVPWADSSARSRVDVELDDSYRVYRPGHTVSGVVLVYLPCAQRAQVSVTFRASLWVRAGAPHAKTSESVIIDEKLVLCETKVLEEGDHKFPFQFALPDNVITSIDFDVGAIEYVIKGAIDRPKKQAKVSAGRHVRVVSPVDVGTLPPARTVSLVVDIAKRKRKKQISVYLDMPRKGYLPGEQIPVKLKIHHLWDVQSPAAVAVTFSRISRITTEPGQRGFTYRKDLDQSVLGLYTDRKTRVAELNTTLRVPPETFTSLKTSLIAFSYLIEVTLDLNGKLDLHTWANSNPAVKFIDTDRVRDRSGVVSAWSEVVIGTERSNAEVPVTERPEPTIVHAVATPPSSAFSGSDSSSHETTRASIETPQPLSEKAILQMREATLVPSMPEYSEPQQLPSAPVVIAPSPPMDDKAELERRRLQQLVSNPSTDYTSAPAYAREATAPSAPTYSPSNQAIPCYSAPPLGSDSSVHTRDASTSHDSREAKEVHAH